MSYRTRSHRDKNHGPIVEALEAEGVFVVDLSGVGAGCPDLLCYREDRGIRLIEIKNPEHVARTHRKANRKLSKTEQQQADFAKNCPRTVVFTIEEALAAMEIES